MVQNCLHGVKQAQGLSITDTEKESLVEQWEAIAKVMEADKDKNFPNVQHLILRDVLSWLLPWMPEGNQTVWVVQMNEAIGVATSIDAYEKGSEQRRGQSW